MQKPKYKACFSTIKDTLTVRDSFTLHDTIIIPEIKKEWLIKSDTIINTEKVYYRRKGDTTVIICKGDTIYRNHEIIREIKVPIEKYVYKERLFAKWWIWLLILAAIAILLNYKK